MSRVVKRVEANQRCGEQRLQDLRGEVELPENLGRGEGNVQKEDDWNVCETAPSEMSLVLFSLV